MEQSIKDYIVKTQNLRYELFSQIKETEDHDEIDRFDKLMLEIDTLAEEIIRLLNKHQDDLEFEFIMEQLSKLGHAPNLLYDDNGNWVVVTSGFQNADFGDDTGDIQTTFFIEAEEWKPTPREALKHYLSKEE